MLSTNPSKSRMKSAFKTNYVKHGRTITVINIPTKARIRDYAIAAAKAAGTIGADHADDDPEPWLGGTYVAPVVPQYTPDDAPYLGEPSAPRVQNSQSSTGTAKKPFSQTTIGQILGLGLKAGAQTLSNTVNKGQPLTMQTAANILSGLGTDYIMACVAKYKSGAQMTEVERKVAMAEIALEQQGKGVLKQRVGNWVIEHLPEIGIGIVLLIVGITVLVKKK